MTMMDWNEISGDCEIYDFRSGYVMNVNSDKMKEWIGTYVKPMFDEVTNWKYELM